MAQNMLSHKNANRKGFRSASALAVAAMTLALLSGCSKKDDAQSGKDQLARIKEKGEIIIATEGTWAPWTYHDEANNLVGFDVDVAKKIAEKLGVKATFVETAQVHTCPERYNFRCNHIYNQLILRLALQD